MKLIEYLEAQIDVYDLKDKKDIEHYTIIIFDLETNGLIGQQGLKLVTGEKVWDEKEKRKRNVYSNKDLEIAEIGAVSYTFSNKKRSSFSTFIKADLSDEIKKLISWDDTKQNSATDIKRALKSFEAWLKRFPKKIIVAHNGFDYDFKIMNLIGQKFNNEYLKSTFDKNNSSDDTILVDTKKTTVLRKELSHLPWPKGVKDDGGSFAVNNQEALIKMFNINNKNAHTAVEDVKALSKYLLKLRKEMKDK